MTTHPDTTLATIAGVVGVFLGGPAARLICVARGHDQIRLVDRSAICRRCYHTTPARAHR